MCPWGEQRKVSIRLNEAHLLLVCPEAKDIKMSLEIWNPCLEKLRKGLMVPYVAFKYFHGKVGENTVISEMEPDMEPPDFPQGAAHTQAA